MLSNQWRFCLTHDRSMRIVLGLIWFRGVYKVLWNHGFNFIIFFERYVSKRKHTAKKDNTKMSRIPIYSKDGIVDYALVSPEDVELVSKYRWNLKLGCVKTNTTSMHQLIMGKAPGGQAIDHTNRNRLDNQRGNLSFASISQN